MFKIKFLRNILLISLAIVILSPIASVLFVFPSVTSVMIENVKGDAMHVARHLMSSLMIEEKALRKESVSFSLLDMQAENFRLMKMKVFLPSGEVIYPTDCKDIGNINRQKYFHEIVAKGKTHIVIVRKGIESLEGQKVTLDVAETYVPIMKNDKFAGAFEIYYDITATKAAINKMVFASTAMLFTVAVVLFIAVVITLSRAAKTISQREKGEAALCESEGKFKSLSQEFNALLNAIPDTLILLSPDMKVIWANQGAAAGLGKDLSELIPNMSL